MSLLSDLAALAAALSWPVIVGLLLFLYRKSIPRVLRLLASRVKSVSVGIFTFELSQPGLSSLALEHGPLDASNAYLENFQSYVPDLLKGLTETTPLDYAIFDLMSGNGWLTSRLYLLVALLLELRGLKVAVFTERRSMSGIADARPGTTRSFVGQADSNALLAALANANPWLVGAYAEADEAARRNGLTGYALASSIIRDFLSKIRATVPPNDPLEWFQYPSEAAVPQVWEHGKYLNAVSFWQQLRGVINSSYLRDLDLRSRSNDDQARLLLALNGAFVAVVNEDRQFLKLVNRQRYVERIASELGNYSPESANS